MNHYIIETQFRADGVINSTMTTRASFASGLSYYYERCSKMVVTDLYPKVAVLLVDAELNVIEHAVLDTLYEETTEETTGE